MPVINIEKVSAKQLKSLEEIDMLEGLSKPVTLTWLPAKIASEDILPVVQSEVPTDGVEIVEWMQQSAADNALGEGVVNDYNRLGSRLVGGQTGDAYIPGGQRVGNMSVPSLSARSVRSQGYAAINTPIGQQRIGVDQKATFIGNDFLAWGCLPSHVVHGIQWYPILYQWQELAKAPVSSKLRFGNHFGFVMPHFIVVKQSAPLPLMHLTFTFQSNRAQRIKFIGRGVNNYRSELFDDTLDVSSGESEVGYNIFGFPTVGNFVAHLQPEDNAETVLKSLEVVG